MFDGGEWIILHSEKLDDEAEPEEGVKKTETAHEPGRDETIYNHKQEAARIRWSLDIGYTEAQVHDRAPVMYDKAAANEVDQVTEDYNILLEAAA